MGVWYSRMYVCILVSVSSSGDAVGRVGRLLLLRLLVLGHGGVHMMHDPRVLGQVRQLHALGLLLHQQPKIGILR